MRVVHWLAPYRIQGIEQLRTLNFASIRLRAGALLTALDRSRFKLILGERIAPDAGVCIVGKIGLLKIEAQSADWLAQIRSHKARGGKVILDYTDEQLAVETPRSAFYRECLGEVDECACSSNTLLESIGRNFRGRSFVIPDAIEVETRPPKPAIGDPLRLLWFGHNTNLEFLVGFLPRLAMDRRLELTILTNDVGIEWLQSSGLSFPPNLKIECEVWDLAAMQRAAGESDLCIIPSNPGDPFKAGVSSNRLITALALGLPTAADLMGSYVEHRSYFADIRSGEFGAMIADPAAWHGRILEAQNGIVPAHSQKRIGALWLSAISGERVH